MSQQADHLADNFLHDHGRKAIGLAFDLAAKCLENKDSEGYERYFQIYVRLARRSGRAGALSAWHEQASRHQTGDNGVSLKQR